MSAFIGMQLILIVVSGLGGFFSSANGFTSSGTESGGGSGGATAGLDAVVAGLAAAGAVGAEVVAGTATLEAVDGDVNVMDIGGGTAGAVDAAGVAVCPKDTAANKLAVATPMTGSRNLMSSGRE